MTTQAAIAAFLSSRNIAVVGVSRGGRKFANMAYRELKAKGYQVFPVNPHAENVEGEKCYPSLAALPEQVDGAVVVVPPSETEQVVREAARAGIRRIWMQQGAQSDGAIRFCEENGMGVVAGECILMFARSERFPHNAHRWFRKILGRLPQ